MTLIELRKLAEAATAGPWIAGDDEDSDYFLVGPHDGDEIVFRSVVKLHAQNNALFIAAANPAAVISLLDQIEEQQAENDRLNDDVAMHMRVAVKAIDEVVEIKAQRDALAAKLEALEADAERYQFIRARTSGHLNGLGAYFGWPGPLTVVAPRTILKGSVAEHLDKAIDAAKGGQHEDA